jgi:hypothetical protein
MRAGWWPGAFLLLAVAGPADGQQPQPSGPPAGGTTPTAANPGPPQAQTIPPPAKDFFGASPNQPFNEKALFPNAPPGPAPPPPELPPTLIPDGSLPPPPPPKLWYGGFEVGLNGSQGNADVLSLRVGANADRKTPGNLFHVDLLYTTTRQDGVVNQNQALLNARDEILFPNSPWSVFAATQVEYDEFRAYDFRAGAYAGLSRPWVKTDRTLFKTRFGAGAVREISTARGGPPDRWVPEGLLGFDFNHRFTDRQAFVSTVDVYPNLSQLGQYRVRARAGYEIVVDPKHGMVLRLGVQDRYDSSPGRSHRNDLNYFATLLFKF